MRKKLLNLILIIVMCVAFMPMMKGSNVNVWAAGNVAKIVETGQEYATVQEAVNAIVASPEKEGTIQMIADSTENVDIQVGSDLVSIVLDLNGYVLSAPGTGGSVIKNTSRLTIKDSNTDSQKHNFKVGSDGLWTLTTETKTTTLEQLTSRPEANEVIEISGGCVTGGNASTNGGGVYSTNVGTHCWMKLQGGNIVGNTANKGGGVNDANFTMTGGVVCGNKASDGGGIFLSYYESTPSIEGGSVIYNKGANGGGVYVQQSKLSMTEGIIAANEAENGGGIFNFGTTSLSGGNISDNKSTRGGGVYNNQYSTLSINGTAEITGNLASNIGGGVYNVEQYKGFNFKTGSEYTIPGGTFVMSSGTISGNKSPEAGGVSYGESVKLGGTSKITENTLLDGKTANNLYLPNDKTVTLGNGTGDVAVPAEGMTIGVCTETKPSTGSPVNITGVNSGDFSKCFSSDKNEYVIFNEDNTVKLGVKKNEPAGKNGDSASSSKETNKNKEDTKNAGVDTGDHNNPMTYFILFDLMLAGIAALLFARLKTQRK